MHLNRNTCGAIAALCLTTTLLPSAAQPSSGLVIVSWNLEWLADAAALKQSGYWTKCKAQAFSDQTVVAGLPPCTAVAKYGRTAAAYQTNKLHPLRARLAQLADEGMDVLAVQEVGTPAALQAVLPQGWQVACFTQTPQAQNIGYAVRASAASQWKCEQHDDLSLPAPGKTLGRYRPGLELHSPTAGPAGTRLAILNIHLKASCATRDMSDQGHDKAPDCATLQRQVPVLERWMEGQSDSGGAFMVVGDWNRNLEREIQHGRAARTDGSNPSAPPIAKRIRHLWPEINDGVPMGSSVSLAQVDRGPAKGVGCLVYLDQAVISESLLGKLLPTSPVVNKRLGATLLAAPGVSDHCPMRMHLQW